MTSLPTAPIVGITFPTTPAVRAAFDYIQKHNIPSTVNHCVRSAIFALFAASKNPAWATSVDQESLAIAVLLHDLGWSKSTDLTTPHKRFEVDGADDARNFLASSGLGHKWADEALLQSIWYAISLHTNPGISLHTEPIVAATSAGIIVDFMGPMSPPFAATITEDEFREVLKAYPRLGFADDTKEILCGLCMKKPDTTYDNFVGQFGRKHVDGFAEQWEARTFENTIWKAMESTEIYDS